MTGPFGFEGISDASIFGAHKWAADHLEEISHKGVTPVAMQALKARHHVWFHPTKLTTAKEGFEQSQTRGRFYATLRIDAEHKMISGDLFADIRRREWIASWVSEAIFEAPDPRPADWKGQGWDLLSIADIHWPGKDTGRHGRFAKLVVALRAEGENVRACRLIGIDGAQFHLADMSLTDPERHTYDSYRRMVLTNILHARTAEDKAYVELAREALGGQEGTKLREDLRKTGAGIFWDAPKLAKTEAEASSIRYEDYGTYTVRDADIRESELLSRAQWSGDPYGYAVLLTTHQHKKGVSGLVPGLDGERPAQKPRTGAIVYIKQIIDNQLERQGLGFETYFGADGKPRPEFAELTDIIGARIRMFYMHELGHMMNLPHPWQRDVFSTPELPAQPAARTIMNYGSLYPLGRLMEVSRRRSSTDDGVLTTLLRADSDRSFAGALKDAVYTPLEVQWIRHAPFDFFVPSGNVFTGDLREKSRLPPATSHKRPLSLTIWDAGEVEADGTLVLGQRTSEDKRRQPVFGRVTFRVLAKFLEQNYVPFTFQAPSLSLAVRGEYEDRGHADMIRFVQAVPLPFGAGGGLGDMDFDAATRDVTIRGRHYKEFSSTIPLMQHGFFESFTRANDAARGPDAFTLQVVLRTAPRTDGGYAQTFRSNKVRIRFKRRRVAHPRLMDNSNLPLFAEALGNIVMGGSIAELPAFDRHDSDKRVMPLRRLAKAVLDLDPKVQDPDGVSAQLIGHLKQKLADAEQVRLATTGTADALGETIEWARALTPERMDDLRAACGRDCGLLERFDAFVEKHNTKGRDD